MQGFAWCVCVMGAVKHWPLNNLLFKNLRLESCAKKIYLIFWHFWYFLQFKLSMKMAFDRQSKTFIGKIHLSSFKKWYWFGSNKMIKWLKSNISILIFCENLGEFIKESALSVRVLLSFLKLENFSECNINRPIVL